MAASPTTTTFAELLRECDLSVVLHLDLLFERSRRGISPRYSKNSKGGRARQKMAERGVPLPVRVTFEARAGTLEELRALPPPGLMRRTPEDPTNTPVIESWR